ncbi:MAG TPA: hypothetical protein VKT77_11580 [Chthonomonadaceae bacterium]|nr:hypothetical protein [Chthonomonadaceae bacterium]
MTESRYRFLAALTADDGSPIGAAAIAPDWFPAEEAVRFQALRCNRPIGAGTRELCEPVWDGQAGEPYVVSVRLSLGDDAAGAPAALLPITYFAPQAQAAAAQFVQQGKLREGDVFRYRIAALPLPDESAAIGGAREGDWIVEEVSPSPISGERRIAEMLAGSRHAGQSDEADFPVLLPASILAQAEELKTAANENETGGVLIGHLWRDTEGPELLLEVTALVPALHTIAQSTRLTFTPQTWDAVRGTIALRGRGEIMCGYWHSHPSRYWCKCEPEAQKSCPLGRQFFSADDRAVHRAVFSRAFHVALVTGDRPRQEGGWAMEHACYGWRCGTIEARGYHVADTA